MQTTRRSLIIGLASLIAAPAIVRAGSLMPVKAFVGDGAALKGVLDFYNPIVGIWLGSTKGGFFLGDCLSMSDVQSLSHEDKKYILMVSNGFYLTGPLKALSLPAYQCLTTPGNRA
jgi:hypothetical protein